MDKCGMDKFSDFGGNGLLDAANAGLADGTESNSDLQSSLAPEKTADADLEAAEGALSRRRKTTPLHFWIPFMIVTGGSMDFMAGIFSDQVQNAGFSDASVVFLVTSLSFLACAVPPSFSREARASLREVNANNRLFKYKVLVPSLADLVITGLRFVAILYASPAVVSLLKNSMQLLSLSVIQHFRGKRLSCRLGTYLLGIFVGQLLVSIPAVILPTPGVEGPVALGVALACVSGFLGAIRNVVEETLLQEDNVSTSGLLMAESWISFVGFLAWTLIRHSAGGQLQSFLVDVANVCAMAQIWPVLFAVMFCTYGKDFGKLFVTKYASAMTSKVLCMLFPIVTWVLGLATFAGTHGQFGEGLDAISSPVRLVGFSLTAGFCVAFVLLQKKKK